MNREACQNEGAAARTAMTGAGVPTLTRTMAMAGTATGAAECMTMQSGQWSASESREWMWATWATASSASKTRHTIAAGRALGRPWKSCWNRRAFKNSCPYSLRYTGLDAQPKRMASRGASFSSSGAPTPPPCLRLNCVLMLLCATIRGGLMAGLAAFLAVTAAAQSSEPRSPDQKPLVVQPDIPGMRANHRLILKDGSYQMVRRYEVVGDRVRYIPLERSSETDWEELPVDLVDWDATRKWERDHASSAEDEASPAMKEAEAIDKEETAERDEVKARMPEVARGLELPDEDSVFALDTYDGTPELVELVPSEASLNSRTRRGIATLNPMAGQKANIELDGAHAKVHLHVNDPDIFLSLNATDNAEKVLSHAITVNTGGAKEAVNRKRGAHSPQSGFVIVKVDERKAVRIVGAIHISPAGTVSQDEDVIPTQVEVLPGKHWLKVTPQRKLLIGEYALVEILSPTDINDQVWDFRVDPQLGDNEGSLGPIYKQ